MRFRIVREKALTASPSVVEAVHDRRTTLIPRLGGSNIAQQRIGSVFVQAQSASYAYMYQSQPAVRSVADYIASNIAQLGLRLYERVSDDEREHAGDHPAAESLRQPNEQTPGQQFIFNLVAAFLIYDDAFALKFQGPGDRITLLYVPSHAVGIVGQQLFTVEAYRIFRSDGTSFDVPPEAMIHWRGYDPTDPRAGFSKLETLRQELAADATSRAAKTELDRSGLMPKAWLERPLEAPEWSDTGRQRFKEDAANMARDSNRHLPVWEEGMQFKTAGVSPEEAQMLSFREFTKGEVGAQFGMEHCPPRGEEERRQFYADVVQPLCERLCAYLDLQVLQQEYGLDDYYFEFNLDEKKMSDDRLKAITSAVGAPPLTRNEGRAMLNLPAVEDGDEPITPLNVLVGGKPSPQVMPIQDPNKPSQDGDHRTDEPKALPDNSRKILPMYGTDLVLKDGSPVDRGWMGSLFKDVKAEQVQLLLPRLKGDRTRQLRAVDKFAGDLERFYGRMARSMAKKAAPAFDQDRWARELGDDLHERLKAIVEAEADLYSFRLGGDGFDMGQVQNLLSASAYGAADAMVAVTGDEIDERGLGDALEHARSERVGLAASSLGASAIRYARLEAAKQAPNPDRRLKMWVADTARHANLNGATVPLDGSWGGIEPGQPPNCKCTVSVL